MALYIEEEAGTLAVWAQGLCAERVRRGRETEGGREGGDVSSINTTAFCWVARFFPWSLSSSCRCLTYPQCLSTWAASEWNRRRGQPLPSAGTYRARKQQQQQQQQQPWSVISLTWSVILVFLLFLVQLKWSCFRTSPNQPSPPFFLHFKVISCYWGNSVSFLACIF